MGRAQKSYTFSYKTTNVQSNSQPYIYKMESFCTLSLCIYIVTSHLRSLSLSSCSLSFTQKYTVFALNPLKHIVDFIPYACARSACVCLISFSAKCVYSSIFISQLLRSFCFLRIHCHCGKKQTRNCNTS